MPRVRRCAALALLVTTEAAAVVAVQRLGRRAPFDLPLDRLQPWLRADPADALAAALRLAALVAASWLLAITLVYLLARRAGIPVLLRACEHVAPRLVRLAADRALAASIVVGAFAAPWHLTRDPAPGPVVVEVRSGREPGAGSVASLPSDTGTSTRARPVPTPPRDTMPVASPGAPPPVPVSSPAAAPTTATVEPGDSLWEIAARAVARATNRDRAELGADEIARYWVALCDANRASLRSGDVNLVYPGETVVLPPLR
jgi:hypothetical protein